MNFWRWSLSLVCMVAVFGLLGSGLSSFAGGDKDKDKDKDKKEVKKDEKDAKDKDAKKVDEKDKDAKKVDDKDKDAKKVDDKDKDAKKVDDKDKDAKKVDDKDKDAKKEDKTKEVAKGDYTWKGFDGKEFFQELKTVTEQDIAVMDQKIKQKQEQTFHVSWTPKEKDKEGNWVVDQKILGMKMMIDIGGNKIAYDSAAEKIASNPMSDFFNNLKGATLTYTISPKLEIVKIDGRDVLITKLSATNPQMKTLLETLLSEEALKQMAQPTWGAFPAETRKENAWSKNVKLNLGNIGSYNSQLDYKISAKDKNKIDISSTLEYTAPSKDAKAPKLPFTIKEAKKGKMDAKGTGVAEFDQDKGRFSKVEMTTNIKGLELVIEVGNVDTNVTINQSQTSTVTTSDAPFGKAKEASK